MRREYTSPACIVYFEALDVVMDFDDPKKFQAGKVRKCFLNEAAPSVRDLPAAQSRREAMLVGQWMVGQRLDCTVPIPTCLIKRRVDNMQKVYAEMTTEQEAGDGKD